MRIEERNRRSYVGSYFLCDNERMIALADMMSINGEVKSVSRIYKSLINKELGSYEDIIGKTFRLVNDRGNIAVLSDGFAEYIIKEEKKEEIARLQQDILQRQQNDIERMFEGPCWMF